MKRESVIFIILLGISLFAGCAENGTEEPEPAGFPVETPAQTPAFPSKTPAEVPVLPAEVPASSRNR